MPFILVAEPLKTRCGINYILCEAWNTFCSSSMHLSAIIFTKITSSVEQHLDDDGDKDTQSHYATPCVRHRCQLLTVFTVALQSRCAVVQTWKLRSRSEVTYQGHTAPSVAKPYLEPKQRCCCCALNHMLHFSQLTDRKFFSVLC